VRIHELIPYDGLDLIVHNEKSSHTVVLTSAGAVFNNEKTDDVLNMSIAFGLLFTSDKWRIATTEEVKQFRERPDDQMMTLSWSVPEPKKAVHIVKE
jgi:hypothetical protein